MTAPRDQPGPRAADAIRLSVDDNVATVLRPIAEGERILVQKGQETSVVVARQTIPLCHKIALIEIAAGSRITKYGQPIGEATAPISAGTCVHVHNMRSLRARKV